MKVRVAYTEDVSDDFRRAIRRYHGETGLATRKEVQDWFYLYGQSENDSITMLLDMSEEKNG